MDAMSFCIHGYGGFLLKRRANKRGLYLKVLKITLFANYGNPDYPVLSVESITYTNEKDMNRFVTFY